MRDVGLLLLFEQFIDYDQVIHCSNFKAVVSQKTGRPRSGGEKGTGWSVGQSEHTHLVRSHICVWFVAPPKIYNSDINDHSQTIITKKIIMKIFKILQELPKCDTETKVSKCC